MLLFASAAAQAQQVMVQANVAEDTLKNSFGPNRKLFVHSYVGYGLVAGAGGSGAAVRYGFPSYEVQAGARCKRRFSQTFALNLDARYAYLRYALAQNDQKTLPTSAQHRAENLALHQLQAEISLRLNAGRRGNAIGRYLDLLAWGSWAAATRHETDDEPAPGIGSVETIEAGLPYLRRFGGGVGARLGSDRYAVVARCRLSSVFVDDYAAWPELPRWILGLEIGLF